MLKKKEAVHAVSISYKLLFNLLKINTKDVKVHVVNSKAKKYSSNGKHVAEIFINEKGIKLYLYYNLHSSSTDLIASLIHELLHIKLLKLTTEYKAKSRKKQMRLEKVEEELVQDLEYAFAKLLIIDLSKYLK